MLVLGRHMDTSIENTDTGSGPEEETQNTPLCSFADLEAIVEKGLSTYQELGAALDEIHHRKFYKPQFKNFKTYLQVRWEISRAHGYRLMAAYKIAQTSPVGDIPTTEREARKRREGKAKRSSNKVNSTSPPHSEAGLLPTEVPSPSGIVTDTDHAHVPIRGQP